VQVGHDDDVDVVGVHAHLLQRVRGVEAVALLALVVILADFAMRDVGHAGIDHDPVLAGLDIEADHRHPDLLARLALPEQVRPQIALNPSGVDGHDPGLLTTHSGASRRGRLWAFGSGLWAFRPIGPKA
jgi:hypothetical protein